MAVNTKVFFDKLKNLDIDFFTGVPDSLLKDFCAYISDNVDKTNNIIAANEGNAVALAAGYHLASQKVPLVYIQNSGIGNTVNPILSLCDSQVYKIPLLMMIGWRGEPGVKDEPQHITQGEVTLNLLNSLKVPYTILNTDNNEVNSQLDDIITKIKESNAPYALIVRKNTFEKYKAQNKIENNYSLVREDVIKEIAKTLSPKDIVVSTTGKTSRELFECREELNQTHATDFLTVGSMGHANQIALGIALQKPNKRVVCIDGDGALLMHSGGLAIIGDLSPKNLVHFVINNGAHESVGGQATVGLDIDVPKLAMANNYKYATSVCNISELNSVLQDLENLDCPALIEIKVKLGSRENLGRPTISPLNNKLNLMINLQK